MDTKEGLCKTQWPNSSTTLPGLPGHCANNEASQDQIIQEPPAFSPEDIQAYNTGLDEERALSALAEKRLEELESALWRCIEASAKWPENRPPRAFKESAEKWRLLLGWRFYNKQQYDQTIKVIEPILVSRTAGYNHLFEASYLLALSFRYKRSDAKVEEYCVQAMRLKPKISTEMKSYFQKSAKLLWEVYKKRNLGDRLAYLENFAFQDEQAEFKGLVRQWLDMSNTNAQNAIFTWLKDNVNLENIQTSMIEVDGKTYGVWGLDCISWSDAFKQTLERSVREAILGTSNGCSLMHILAGCNKWTLITVLLGQKAVLDSCLGYSQFTPLAIAIYYRSFQAANVLLDRKSFIGVKCFGQKNFTLAYLASKTRSMRMKNLISNLAYWQEGKPSSSLQEGRLREAKDLVRKGVNVNFQYGERLMTPLLHVCECYPNETELIILLLEAGASPNVSVDGKLKSSIKTRINMARRILNVDDRTNACSET
ncbi:hypothetical protein ZTR_00730 [Talaromyces verruculosus]|nr:hypothetical protein ZTR_00730 [Talaromyces verruculosus]